MHHALVRRWSATGRRRNCLCNMADGGTNRCRTPQRGNPPFPTRVTARPIDGLDHGGRPARPAEARARAGRSTTDARNRRRCTSRQVAAGCSLGRARSLPVYAHGVPGRCASARLPAADVPTTQQLPSSRPVCWSRPTHVESIGRSSSLIPTAAASSHHRARRWPARAAQRSPRCSHAPTQSLRNADDCHNSPAG